MLELRLKEANWVKVKQERAVAGPHGVQEHEILEEGRKSAWIGGRDGAQGVNQGAAVKMGSIQVLEWAGPHVGQYSVFSQREIVGLTGVCQMSGRESGETWQGVGKICASLSTNATRCEWPQWWPEVGMLDSVRNCFLTGERLKDFFWRVLTPFPSCFAQLT